MADIKTLAAQTGNGNESASGHETTDEALQKITHELKEKAVMERAKELDVPYIDLSVFPINPDVLRTIAPEDSKKALLMPFFKTGKKVRIAVNDPAKPETQEVLKKLETSGYSYQINLASDDGIQAAQNLYTSEQYRPQQEQKIVVAEKKIFEEELKNLLVLKDKIENLPAEEALNTFHAGAIQAGASDIHYQPEEKNCTIRFRIDGVLHKVFDISRDTYLNLAGQLKYRAKMRLNVSNVPQDGRYTFLVNDRKVDVRVSSLPTEFGESFVCRILDPGKHIATFEELGFIGSGLDILKRAAEISHGMILCTGPTGSGKTTTLYALLSIVNSAEVKIITLEDPIEYHLAGVTQSQIDEKHDYTFSSGLRSILRQDPDVVMIGEIRDLETAETACQAALTGHVLLSTLHTNNAAETIPRLLTMGVPASMIAPSLHTIIAQRLVRRLCEKCPQERNISLEERKAFEETVAALKVLNPAFSEAVPEKIKDAKGCEACNLTGYRGQMVISEVLVMNDAMREAVLNQASAAKIFEIARKNGMTTMQEDGIMKVMQNLTTMAEVYRVTLVMDPLKNYVS